MNHVHYFCVLLSDNMQVNAVVTNGINHSFLLTDIDYQAIEIFAKKITGVIVKQKFNIKFQ